MFFKLASHRTVVAMAVCLMLAMLWFCPASSAQVVTSQPVALDHPSWKNSQIWKVIVSSKGDVIAWDFRSNAIFEFPADGTGLKVLVPQAPNVFGGEWSTGGVAFDAEDNLYIGYRWKNYYVKIPYDPVEKTWHVEVSDAVKWGGNVAPSTYWYSPIDISYVPVDKFGKGHYILSDESNNKIFQYDGVSGGGSGTLIVGELKVRAIATAVDKDENLYFQEDMDQGGAVGTFRIPGGLYGLNGNKRDGTMEAGWPVCGTPESLPKAVDDNGNLVLLPCRVDNNLSSKSHGVTLDADGNVYISTQQDFNPGATDKMTGGIFRVPVEKFTVTIDGVQKDVYMPNAAHQVMIAPIPPQGNILVHPEGYLYVPIWADDSANSMSGWNGMANIIKVYLGSAGLPAVPVGQQGTNSQVFFSFNSDVTPDGFAFSQGSQQSVDFALADGGTCVTGTKYTANQRCNINVALTPHVVGSNAGVLAMTAGGSTVAAANVHGVGQGAALSVLTPSTEIAIRSGLVGPKQVAADRWGNFYVADAGAGKVLQYVKGSTESTAPVAISGTFTAPTGVAVDGAGNVFVADSGNIIEVPVSGGGQVVVQSGLGTNLSLGVDGAGNVFAADPDNARVVKVPNTEARILTGSSVATVGRGFTAPTAVAGDDAGNLFVVDGPTLYEVLATGATIPLTNELMSPVGVAVDPSYGVYVAQQDGVMRIPTSNGALQYTQRATIALDTWIPAGIAVDPSGIVYVTDAEQAHLGVLAFGNNGAVDFGFIGLDNTANQNATLFNIGNQDLVFGSPAYASTGGSSEFSLVSVSDHCSGATVVPGSTCSMGFSMTPTGSIGTRQNTGNLQSNAANGSVQLALSGVGSSAAPSMIASITATPSQPVYPGDVTVSVTVAPSSGTETPTGKLSLTFDNNPLRPADLQNGTAQFILRRPNGGQHVVTANYQGDINYASVSASMDPPLTIARANANTTVVPPPTKFGMTDIYVLYHGGYNLRGKIASSAGSPTGTATLTENGLAARNEDGSEVGPAALDANGNVTFNTGGLALGKHTFRLSYSGDTNFLPSTSTEITFQLVNPSLVITTTTPNLALTAGTPGTANLVIYPVAEFNQEGIQLACVNVPQYSECTFSQVTLSFKESSPAPIQMTISTNVPVNVGAVRENLQPGSGMWLATVSFAVGLVGLGFGRKTRYNGRVLMIICCLLIISGAMAGLTACGNSGYTKTPPAPHVTTPSGTTNVSVVATRNGQPVSLPFTLSVTVQ